MKNAEIREIVLELGIEAPCDRVWKIMVEDLSKWWPSTSLVCPEAKQMNLEAWAGGRLWEHTEDGRQTLWGTVVQIMPGKSLDLAGFTSPQYGGPTFGIYRLVLQEDGPRRTSFRFTASSVGNGSDDMDADYNEGWKSIFRGFKEYAEGPARQD